MVYGPTQSNPVGGDHGDLIAALAAFLKPDRYLELGCHEYTTLKKVAPHCRNAIGVDRYLSPRLDGDFIVEQCDTVEFMKTMPPDSFDMIFLDSSHEYEATLREITEIERVLRPNGVLAMHDTYPPNEDQERQGYCGDVWRAIDCLKDAPEIWECSTLPAQYGLTIARKLPVNGKQLAWKA